MRPYIFPVYLARLRVETRFRLLAFAARRKKALKAAAFYLAMALFTLCAAEAAAAAFFHYARDRFTFADFSDYLVDEWRLPDLKAGYDYELGWTNHYATPYGERPRRAVYDESLMATFGDSFTHCDQVDHDETWQHYLSKKIGKNVFNFGVGGYGTDQAYLRFRRKYPLVKTPVSTLALVPENISRVANVYRKFYFPATGGQITKPRFTLDGEGKLRLLENPVKNPDELIKLRDPAFLHRIGQNDFWYMRNDYPVFGFPFLKIFFSKRFWLEVRYLKSDARIDDMMARPAYYNDIWKSPEKDVLLAIFDAFVKDAGAMGTEPVIMVIPSKVEARFLFDKGRLPESVRIILDHCRAKGYNVFDAVTGLVRNARTESDIDSYYVGHVSARGNRLIAGAFHEFLAEKRLLN